MAEKKKTVRKTTNKTTVAAPAVQPMLSEQELRAWIEVAAYYRAERRQFQGGDPSADWFEAEAEIRERLAHSDHAHA